MGVTHSFINKSDRDAVFVTGWRPGGFERFFADFGVPVLEADAQERSVAPELIQRVIETAASYGMILDNK